MRILVVEDELHLSEALSHILKKNNYTVDVANDGETGLDDALSGIYDVNQSVKLVFTVKIGIFKQRI